MKSKTILFSNFKYDYLNKNENINTLPIEEISNLKTDNGYIESELSSKELIYELFNENEISTLKEQNREIINNTIKFIPYEFFNENTNKINSRLFCITQENKLFELNFESLNFEEKYIFSDLKNDVIYNNILYLFDSENKCIVIENNNILTIENIPYINSFISNDDNLYFSIDNIPNKIFISDCKNLKDISTNFEQYSTINIPIEYGMILKVINVKNNIFIITQYAILKIDKTKNVVQKQNFINSLIFKNSIIQFDDSILFYCENGLYIFDGTDIKQIFNNFLNLSKNAIFVNFNHKLYILSLDFKNIIYTYNINTNQISFIKINDIDNIYKINSYSNHCFCVCHKEENSFKTISLYSNNSNSLTQRLKFKPIFLDSNSLKQIQSLYINSTGEFELKISSDITSQIFNISNITQFKNLTLNGNYFIFEIHSSSKFKLNSIMITFSEIGELWLTTQSKIYSNRF